MTAHPPPSSLTPVPYGPPCRVSVVAVAVLLCQGCAVVVGSDGDGLWQFKIRRQYVTCFKIHVFVQLEQSLSSNFRLYRHKPLTPALRRPPP